jgi:hypothetical protein
MFVKVTTSDGRPAWLKAEDVSHVYEDWVQLKHNTGAYKLPPGHGESLVRLLCAYGGEQPSGPVDLAEFVEAEKHPLKVVTGPVCSLSEEQLKSMRDVMESLRLGEQIGRTVLAGGDAASPDDFGVDRECEYEWEPGRAWIVELPPTGGPPVYLKPGDKLLPGRRYKVVDKPPAAALYERDAVGVGAVEVPVSVGFDPAAPGGDYTAKVAVTFGTVPDGRAVFEFLRFNTSEPLAPELARCLNCREARTVSGLCARMEETGERYYVCPTCGGTKFEATGKVLSAEDVGDGWKVVTRVGVVAGDKAFDVADLPPPLDQAGFEFPPKDKGGAPRPGTPWEKEVRPEPGAAPLPPLTEEVTVEFEGRVVPPGEEPKSWRDLPSQL